MAFLENALNLIFSKSTITNPIFIRDFQKENEQLRDLIELSCKVTSSKKNFIDRDITLLKQGLAGEQNVYYELKNSFLPILCLHDIRLEYQDYAAQLDFVVISHKSIYILETKKLNGDIEINSDGDFIRIIKNNFGKVVKKEGMYSPISQNQRHVNILKELLIKEGLIRKLPVKSAVVIANPKTIINKYKSPKDMQKNIYKYDQLSNLLKKELADKNNDMNLLDKYMYDIANFLVKNNKPIKIDYMSKYSLTDEDFNTENLKEAEICTVSQLACTNDSVLCDNLKKYRLETSKQENVKPYFIFTNAQLDFLVEAKPKTKDELLKISGFGEKKVERYGDSIINIINAAE